MDEDILRKLEQRLGRLHARQRLGNENDHEAQLYGQGLNYFHIEKHQADAPHIRNTHMLTGL